MHTAPSPAKSMNQNQADSGIPNRFNPTGKCSSVSHQIGETERRNGPHRDHRGRVRGDSQNAPDRLGCPRRLDEAIRPQSPQLHQHLQKTVFLDVRARQTTELARKLALRPSQWRRKNTLIQSDIGKTT